MQALFITFLVACVAALALCFPRLSDQPRMTALQDLARLSSTMDVQPLPERVVAAVNVPNLRQTGTRG